MPKDCVIEVPPLDRSDEVLPLEEYLPFRLLALTNGITRTTSMLVQNTYHLSMREWRVMLIVAASPGVTGIEVAERLNSDKMIVSRAAGDLLRRGLIRRSVDPADRRRGRLLLTREGETCYRRMVRLARAYDDALRSALSSAERRTLETVLEKLERRVAAIEFHQNG